MQALEVIEDPATAVVALEPVRARLLAALAEPGSATTLAKRFDLPRQKVNYHLRALEAHGLVTLTEERARRGFTERVLQASASSYVVSPGALGGAAADPARVPDRLSAAYLVALAGRAVREVGDLLRGAREAGRRLPTLSLDVDVRFASAADRSAFAAELAGAVRGLAARYHDEGAEDGRTYRVVVLAHPRPGGEGA